MRVRGRDVYASYEGSYGVGGDVCATGGAPSWGGGGGQIFVVFWGGNPGAVGAGGEAYSIRSTQSICEADTCAP